MASLECRIVPSKADCFSVTFLLQIIVSVYFLYLFENIRRAIFQFQLLFFVYPVCDGYSALGLISGDLAGITLNESFVVIL